MSWITPDDIMKMFEKEDGLTQRQISDRLSDDLTDSALNRHLRRLAGGRFGHTLYRVWKNGAYVYYKSRN